MKNQGLVILAISSLIVSGCTPSSKPEKITMVDKDVDVTMAALFGDDFGEGEYVDAWKYSDYWFLNNSNDTNYELAVMSAMTGGMSYTNKKDEYGNKIISFLNDVGYKAIKRNQYYENSIRLEDSLGVIAAHKKIKDNDNKVYTLLTVFPRNAGYGAEWMGNFTMGDSGIHSGFKQARDEMLRFTKKYITDNKIKGNIKLWTAGYSRGSAAASLFSGYLADNPSYLGKNINLTPENIFSYNIGVPASIIDELSKKEVLSVSGPRGEGYYDTPVEAYTYTGEGNINLAGDQYKGIHNFVAVGDYVTKLPPESWGFTRYGNTEEITYGSEEMLDYLEVLSQETADKFSDGRNYSTEESKKTFDLKTFEVVELNEKISADELIDERFEALESLSGNRSGFATKGFDKILGSLTSIYGVDSTDFIDKLTSNVGSLAKTGVLAYLAYAAEKQQLSDADAVSKFLMDVLELAGKNIDDRENYTDQDLLKVLFDYLINDYVDSEDAIKRANKLKSIIPAPYDDLYIGVLDYAKEHTMKIETFDDLFLLLGSYVREHRNEEAVQNVGQALAGVIPDLAFYILPSITEGDYSEVPEDQVKKEVVLDLLECCVTGSKKGTADAYKIRYTIAQFPKLLLSDCPKLCDLIANGTRDGESSEPVVNTPNKVSEVVGEVLAYALNGKSLKEASNEAIADLIRSCKTSRSEKYAEYIATHGDTFRELLVTLLFNPGNEYSLASDLENAFTFIDRISFFAPAHYHEMYISYLKTQVVEE